MIFILGIIAGIILDRVFLYYMGKSICENYHEDDRKAWYSYRDGYVQGVLCERKRFRNGIIETEPYVCVTTKKMQRLAAEQLDLKDKLDRLEKHLRTSLPSWNNRVLDDVIHGKTYRGKSLKD